ncbi:MAG: hypothetical protein ABEJ79_04340 [Halolamina sp.]
MRRLRAVAGGAVAVAALGLAGTAAAHGGGLSNAGREGLSIPTWLFLTTGGGVIGASFLLASFVTDRGFVARVHAWRRGVALPGRALALVGRGVGLVGLTVVIVAGLLGPPAALANAAVLVVWVGWWAGLVMATYLVGNVWPAVDPFRALTGLVAAERVPFPERLGRWPAAVGFLLFVWVEVVSPIADDPRLLAGVVVAYAVLGTVVAGLFGQRVWIERVDPVSALFEMYGRVAPVTAVPDVDAVEETPTTEVDVDDRGEAARADGGSGEPPDAGAGGVAVRLPGAGLVDRLATDRATVGLVVALLWGTTFDGLVQTPAWVDFARAVVGAGVPAAVLYPAALAAGYVAFLVAYRGACRQARSLAPTYLGADALARAFAPSLLAIAAGYHVAHYLGYFLALSPALASALSAPLSGGSELVLSLPGWVGAVPIVGVLLGHLLAVWVAHGVAFERFPSRLQAIRSQYAITLVMVAYTMVSLWIVTRPPADPPFI